ncbi:hypothetical protein BK739_07315 [Bacillus thuringiensis serovar pirenaica]|uniref:cysteine-rich VLP protein n=1 Tax=Bacillus cereus group TaxID=86661 RepID=UPI000A3BA9EE|nr:cysteine-rich VLP protein [Bacillus thuringiensis]OUB32232.1 hypothetical protein BK739_07315 [Bacillus thuringiensis serovar pirenaica]
MRIETKVKRLVRETCACYTPKEGNCVYQEKCPFLHSMCYRGKEVKFESKRCDYFETHVLPADKELHALYFNEGQSGKVCGVCNNYFIAKGNRAKYCDGCRDKVRKRQSGERMRKFNQKVG